MRWLSFRGGRAEQADEVILNSGSYMGAPAGAGVSSGTHLSLDAIGQRSEIVRQRIESMADRLEDLRTLQDDFNGILAPLAEISLELPKTRTRIAELESSLLQERQSTLSARQEAAELSRKVTVLDNEISSLTARAEQAEADLRQREAVDEENRLMLRDAKLGVENLERQLFDETEQNKSLLAEAKALRLEAQADSAALARAEHELQSTRERLGLLEQDSRRLQLLTEEQAGELSGAKLREEEISVARDELQHRLLELEMQLESEVSRREHAEAQLATESSAYRASRASLEMKIQGALHRVSATDQIVAQLRNQLKERDEATRNAERSAKESAISRSSAERLAQSLQTDIARQSERVLEMQRIKTEMENRCDMLSKAIAAKDATIDQYSERNASLTDRVAELTHRFQGERAELETLNRRLMEDLETERSERALVQGALDIARESRTTLQKQHEALKRGWRAGELRAQGVDETNVHPFPPSAK